MNMTPLKIRDQLLSDGYRAKVDDDDGAEATMIWSGVDGIPFSILCFHTSPPDGDLDAIQSLTFSAAIDVDGKPDLVRLNKANAENRFLKAYAEEGFVWVEMDAPVPDSGLGKETFEELFTAWTTLLPAFVQEVI